MKAVLIILFNHKFERNLPRLRALYGSRFDDIYFIMPFYEGDDADVIPVYGNSFYFQGYLAQALARIHDDRFDHYLVIGDDLLLHPAIDQYNYNSYFNLKEDEGFVPEVFLINDEVSPRRLMRKASQWFWNYNAVQFDLDQKGIEVLNELPNAAEAKRLLQNHGFNFEPLLPKHMLTTGYPTYGAENVKHLKTYAVHLYNAVLKNFKLRDDERRKIKYPMVASYSDIVIIPKKSVRKFAHYSGVMAALNLFVEIAIPTALLLAVEKVVQEKDLKGQGLTLWESSEFKKLEDQYNNDLKTLSDSFPSDTLYIHPIKLSKWK
jgi:hypothetical protein